MPEFFQIGDRVINLSNVICFERKYYPQTSTVSIKIFLNIGEEDGASPMLIVDGDDAVVLWAWILAKCNNANFAKVQIS